jgi:hypothetical protein
MLRIIMPLLCIAAVPWGILTWFRMRVARSEKERAFIGRTHAGLAMFVVLSVIALVMLGGRERMFALPIVAVIGMGIRQGIRKGRERIQAEQAAAQADPLRRAKRVN